MHFQFPQKVLFKHCDPAGIVFYPRFFEMINDAVEAMFSDALGWPFEDIHPDQGVPTASISVQFKAPCRHGDQLMLAIEIKAIGTSSLTLKTRATAPDQLRFEADHTLVCVGADGRPTAWPDDMRHKITGLMEGRT